MELEDVATFRTLIIQIYGAKTPYKLLISPRILREGPDSEMDGTFMPNEIKMKPKASPFKFIL
ncbi:hypothetical protein FTO70_00440 [Methanosarcina sp. KYL-1]|uniref:hypothetical protein n=1 Tax=Methanosarcina sp. KYL-1 TaxID=2602068 RepID=UPI002100C339|nr:hypothetical protein [Methanosarcina sp. KYL-1]MCQ1534188.1 hypothetical protein [Methanosarcina sp. KYL-1]